MKDKSEKLVQLSWVLLQCAASVIKSQTRVLDEELNSAVSFMLLISIFTFKKQSEKLPEATLD